MKKILIVLAVLVIGIQFIPVKRTNPTVVYIDSIRSSSLVS